MIKSKVGTKRSDGRKSEDVSAETLCREEDESADGVSKANYLEIFVVDPFFCFVLL